MHNHDEPFTHLYLLFKIESMALLHSIECDYYSLGVLIAFCITLLCPSIVLGNVSIVLWNVSIVLCGCAVLCGCQLWACSVLLLLFRY